MIYSLRCCDPCEITSQKFYTYVCTYVCASVCPALKSPPFFQSFFAHHSIIPLLFLSLFSESSSNRSDRMIDGLSLSLSITLYIYLSLSLTCPSEWSLRECVDSMFEPRAFYQPWIKEGINYYDS